MSVEARYRDALEHHRRMLAWARACAPARVEVTSVRIYAGTALEPESPHATVDLHPWGMVAALCTKA